MLPSLADWIVVAAAPIVKLDEAPLTLLPFVVEDALPDVCCLVLEALLDSLLEAAAEPESPSPVLDASAPET